MLWWMRGDSRLSDRAKDLIRDGGNQLFWSLASSWELAIKIGLGKLSLDQPTHRFFADLISEQGLTILEVRHDHCTRVAELPLLHRDPFDRMLVAQAQVERVPLLTADPKMELYDVRTLA